MTLTVRTAVDCALAAIGIASTAATARSLLMVDVTCTRLRDSEIIPPAEARLPGTRPKGWYARCWTGTRDQKPTPRPSTRMKVAVAAVGCALTCFAAEVRAQTDDLPVIVGYVAPPECAASGAFQALVTAEVSRVPNPDRPWRFSVSVRHDGDGFTGTLKTETAARELHASTCDEVTAALATMIATAQPQLPAPPPPAPPPPPVAPAPQIVVPVADVPQTAEHRWSPSMLATGVVMTTAGVVAVPVGLWVIVSGRDVAYMTMMCVAGGSCGPAFNNHTGTDVAGVAIIAGGAGLAVSGVVMMALGLHKRQVTVGAGPAGSTGASLRVSF